MIIGPRYQRFYPLPRGKVVSILRAANPEIQIWPNRAATLFRDKIAKRLDPQRHLHLKTENTADELMIFCWLPARAGEMLNASGKFPVFTHPYRAEKFDEVLRPVREKNINDFFAVAFRKAFAKLGLRHFDVVLFPATGIIPVFGIVGYIMYAMLKETKITDKDCERLKKRAKYYTETVFSGPFQPPE